MLQMIRLCHEKAAALTSHSCFITCASPVMWDGSKAVQKLLSWHLAKDECKDVQHILEGTTYMWNEIYWDLSDPINS